MRYLILFFLFLSNLYSQEVTIKWDHNTEPDLAGYKVYFGTKSGDYPYVVPAGAGRYIVENEFTFYNLYKDAVGDSVFFVVTALDSSNNESPFSDEVWIYVDSDSNIIIPNRDSISPAKPDIFRSITIKGYQNMKIGRTKND